MEALGDGCWGRVYTQAESRPVWMLSRRDTAVALQITHFIWVLVYIGASELAKLAESVSLGFKWETLPHYIQWRSNTPPTHTFIYICMHTLYIYMQKGKSNILVWCFFFFLPVHWSTWTLFIIKSMKTYWKCNFSSAGLHEPLGYFHIPFSDRQYLGLIGSEVP